MKTITTAAFLLLALFVEIAGHAQSIPSDCTNCLFLNSWSFADTNDWTSDAGYSPVAFTNIASVPGIIGTNLLIDTTNATPAFLFYNVVETNKDSSTFTNITLSAGTIYTWFNPDWSSTNQGGTGPGYYANFISLGQVGTNGPWWGWYLSADGCTAYFGSQTNGGSPSVYLSAPVSFIASNWYNLVLTYSSTNSLFFTNGVEVTNGTGVTYWPGSNANFFAIGSDTNGFYQARGMFSRVETYNFQIDPGSIQDYFGMLSLFYGLAGSGGQSETKGLTDAPPLDPPHWFSGLGDLQYVSSADCTNTSESNIVWITNVSVTLQTNQTASVTFTIEGGLTNSYYDVFGCTSFGSSATNTIWAWLGQGQTCTVYTINNLPSSGVFLMLGTLIPAPDNDGLTLAFEALVSHTNPNSATNYGLPNAWIALNGLEGTNGVAGADPDQDGLNNMQEYLYGTQPLISEGITPWVGNPSGFSGLP